MSAWKEYRPLLCGVALGFVIGMIACWTSPAYIFQRIGMGVVMLVATTAAIWLSTVVLDQALRALKLHRLFVDFIAERMKRERARESEDE